MSGSTFGWSGETEMASVNELALSEIPRGVVVCDEHRRIIMVNPGFEKLTGYRCWGRVAAFYWARIPIQ